MFVVQYILYPLVHHPACTYLPLKGGGVVGVSSLEVHRAVVGPDHPLVPAGHLRDHLFVASGTKESVVIFVFVLDGKR